MSRSNGKDHAPRGRTLVCSGFIMGHGDHWRCVFPDLEKGISRAVGWVSKGSVVGQREQSGLRATFVVVRDQQTGKAYLHTAFPAAALGCTHSIRIDSVHEINRGLEARISGVVGDAAVTFFDPLCCLNQDRYRPGALVDVELAGIAYSLRTMSPETTVQSAVGDLKMDGAAVLLSARKRDSGPENRVFGDEQAYGVAYIEQADIRTFSRENAETLALMKVGSVLRIPKRLLTPHSRAAKDKKG